MNSALLRRVLVVDDEPNIVSAVRRELNTPPLGRFRYEVEGFSDPALALERAKVQGFDAVVSDYRMPGMDGLAFLKALSVLQPDCARLVLSGQTDMEALVKMVNETHVFRFIPKPWHDYFLKSSVAQAIHYNSARQDNRHLAAKVRERNIPLPHLLDNVEQILIVDDEPDILASLARTLDTHTRVDDLFAVIRKEIADDDAPAAAGTKPSVQVTTSARHALKMADDLSFACILTDYKMPEMNGIELLQQFADKQPDCARVLVSGNLTQDELVTAVDNAHIFGFIAKPWQDYELKACVAQALAHRRMQIENRILAEMVRKAGVVDA